jgi:hypothetical protein
MHMSGDGGSGSEGLLDDVPYLARGVDHGAEYRNYQARAAPRHRVQFAYSARAELGAVQRHLPPLLAGDSRLLANICHSCREFVHFATMARSGELPLSSRQCSGEWFAYPSSLCCCFVITIAILYIFPYVLP